MARAQNGMLIFTVSAGAYFISDFAQQIAWLAATLRKSPYENMPAVCYPRVASIRPGSSLGYDSADKTTRTCYISLSFERLRVDGYSEDGLCWACMFRNPILVTGFPTSRRLDSKPGLEMSLGTMAGLALSDEVVKIGERIIIKSFNMLLIAALTTTSVAVWHCFVGERPGERISHFDNRLDALNTSHSNMCSLRSLDSVRHIVGWCSEATDLCGMP